MDFVIREADLESNEDQQAVVALLNEYAIDLKGYNKPLSDSVRRELIPQLAAMPTRLVFVALKDSEYIGMAICFLGFSTFYARPLINIHDFTVRRGFRNQGVGAALLAAVEREARARGCRKLTLETGERNDKARRLYERCGFSSSATDEGEGRTLFLEKHLRESG